jgi:hypothetical protein
MGTKKNSKLLNGNTRYGVPTMIIVVPMQSVEGFSPLRKNVHFIATLEDAQRAFQQLSCIWGLQIGDVVVIGAS